MSPAGNGDGGIAARLEQILGEGRKAGAGKGGNLCFPLCLILHQTWFSVLISFFSSPNFPSPGDLAPRKFLKLKKGCIFFFGSVLSSQSLTGGDGAAGWVIWTQGWLWGRGARASLPCQLCLAVSAARALCCMKGCTKHCSRFDQTRASG